MVAMCIQEVEAKKIPAVVTMTREKLLVRISGRNRESNRKKISKLINPWFFRTLHTVSCSAPLSLLFLEKIHRRAIRYEIGLR